MGITPNDAEYMISYLSSMHYVVVSPSEKNELQRTSFLHSQPPSDSISYSIMQVILISSYDFRHYMQFARVSQRVCVFGGGGQWNLN